MVKVSKLFTLEIGVAEELAKLPNQSSIVNELLVSYFADGKNLEIDEVKLKIKQKTDEHHEQLNEIEVLEMRLTELEQAEEHQKKIFKNIPKKVLEDFKAFPDMTLEVLEQRNKEIYHHDMIQIKAAYDEFYST